MNIRQAVKADIEQVAKLLFQVQEIHAQGRPDLFVSGARKYTNAELEMIFEDTENRPVFVAETDGRILGYAFCIFEETPPSHSLRHIKSLYIDDLCVDESARNAHVGTALYDHVVGYAKDRDCKRITLNVWELNASARRFYEKKGLLPLKTVMEKML